MFSRIIAFSLKNKILILSGIVLIIGFGVYSAREIPLDAVPDITNNQVQIVTHTPTLTTEEVEQFVTFPVEMTMANLPDIEEVRSISRYGLSVITVVFDDNVPTWDARQYVREQLDIAREKIPEGFGNPQLMPVTTGLGEIYQYVLQVRPGYEQKYSSTYLRTLHDWVIKRQLAGIPGIIDISGFGGFIKQYEVAVKPRKLLDADVTLAEVHAALRENNANTGSGYIENEGNAFFIRARGQVYDAEAIENIPAAQRSGVPVLIKDIAEVREGHALRYGAMTKDGKGEAVGGITMMYKGANSARVVERVKERVSEVQKTLPEGIVIEPYLDRSELVNRTIDTVKTNLIEGGIIVILVLILLLGNFRAGLITASVIPLSFLFALGLMNLFGVSANLMSLGAIDFGIVVDGAVIITENVLFVLMATYAGQKLTQEQMDGAVHKASSSIYKSAAFGVFIILLVLIPVFTLTGTEGKMFRPMVQTLSFVLMGAFFMSLTYVPVMASLFLKKRIVKTNNFSDKLNRKLRDFYRPGLRAAIEYPAAVISAALILIVAAVLMFRTMGAEFVPTLEEGDLAMELNMQPGNSLSEMKRTCSYTEELLLTRFPEVKHVVSKIGTAEIPTDPMSIESADVMIVMKPKGDWETAETRVEMIEMMKTLLEAKITDVEFEFSQPIQLRFNELLTGIKSDVAVKIFGEDLRELARLGNEAAELIKGISGAADVRVEKTEGLPQLLIDYDRDEVARYGLNIKELNAMIRSAYAGEKTGIVVEGERKFDLVVRLAPEYRENLDLSGLPVHLPDGSNIPLSRVAKVSMTEGPAQVSREGANRRIVIGVNVRNRDIESLVEAVRDELRSELKLPPGYSIQYGGEFQKLNDAVNRLQVAVPVALLLIFIMLYLAFHSLRDALLIFTAVPFSAVGGVFILMMRGMPFSISAGIGFIALFGVAVLNGIVLLSAYNQLKKEGIMDIRKLTESGSLSRLRPVLMTAVTTALGFLPMALSTTAGAEVQRPLATVVVGGMISSTLLTLFVLPALYVSVSRLKLKFSKGFGVFLIFTVAGFTAGAQQLTLESAVDSAVNRNPGLTNAALNIESAKLDKQKAVELGPANAQYMYGQIDVPLPEYMFQFTQNFGNLPMQFARRKEADARINEAEETYKLELRNIKRRVKQEYYNKLLAEEEVKLFERADSIYTPFINRSEERYESGDIDKLDLRLAEADYNRFRNRKREARNKAVEAEARLRQVCYLRGEIDLPNFKISELPVLNVNTPLDSSILNASEERINVAMRRVKTQKRGYSPSFYAGYVNQKQNDIPGLQAVIVGLQFPLWFVPVKKSIQQQRVELERERNNYTEAENRFGTEAGRVTARYENARKSLNEFGIQQRDLARELSRQALLKRENGEIDYFRYVQIMRMAVEAEQDYLNTLNEYLNAYADYEFYQVR